MRRKLKFALLIVAALLLAAIVFIVIFVEQPWEAAPSPARTAQETPRITPPVSGPPPLQTELPFPDAGSPEGIVRQYLACWGLRDEAGMAALVIEAHREDPVQDLSYVASIDVAACQALAQADAEARFDLDLYPGAFGTAIVRADFTIRYNQAGRDFFLRGTSERDEYLFWLVRETEGGNWRIALQGY